MSLKREVKRMSSPANSLTERFSDIKQDGDGNRLKKSSEEDDTLSPIATSKNLSTPTSLHSSILLQESGGNLIRKSAFLPYRPNASVLTNLQRGNTAATFCAAEVTLSFHERSGQGEITEEHVRLELERQRDLGSNIDFRDTTDFTSLHWASYYGQLTAVKLLLDAGADVNAEAPELVTALLLAASGGHHEVVRLLLEHGANAGHMDIIGNTALMYAAAGNHPHTCKELLDRDPDMTASNENGDTAYSLATGNGALLSQAVLEQYLNAMLSL